MNESSLVLCWDFCCTSCFLYQTLYCPVVLLFSFLISHCFPQISLDSRYVYTSCFYVFCDANFMRYVTIAAFSGAKAERPKNGNTPEWNHAWGHERKLLHHFWRGVLMVCNASEPNLPLIHPER